MTFRWHHFRAMGTRIGVYTDRQVTVDRVADIFEAVENTASRFRPDSELTRINRLPNGNVEISGIAASILEWSDELRHRTDGLVDIGVGQAVNCWGYDRDFSQVTDRPVRPSRPEPGTWGIEGSTLTRTGSVQLDLGGVAKGWTADLAVADTNAWLVNAGGDIRSQHPDTHADIVDAHAGSVARVRIGEGAIATSTTAKRTWRVGNDTAHHLIDPRTQAPADTPIRAASAIAETAVEAEAGAKAILLLGADGLAWADEQDWIRSAIVVWHDGAVYATTGAEIGAAA